MDPSLRNYGWVVREWPDGEIIARGKFQTFPKEMHFVERNCYLREAVAGLCRDYQPEAVGIESPTHGDSYSEGMYALFVYSCEALWREKQRVIFLSPGQGKVHARVYSEEQGILPPGFTTKMEKADMVRAARHAMGGRWNEHEADAFWIGWGSYRFWAFQDGILSEEDLAPHEKHQFTRVHTYVRGKKKGKTVKKGIVYRESDRYFRWDLETKSNGRSSSNRSNRRRKAQSGKEGHQKEDHQKEGGQEGNA